MLFEHYPTLENQRIILRQPGPEDLPELEAMLQDPEVYQFEPAYLPELLNPDCQAFLTKDCLRLFCEKQCILLGIYRKSLDQDRPAPMLGIAELYNYLPARNKISIGYRLRSAYWHQGIASQAVALLKDYVLGTLQMERITAHVQLGNPASEQVLLRNGFQKRNAVRQEDWGFLEPTPAYKFVLDACPQPTPKERT